MSVAAPDQIDEAAIRYGNAMPYTPATGAPAAFCMKLAVKFVTKGGIPVGGSPVGGSSSGGAGPPAQ